MGYLGGRRQYMNECCYVLDVVLTYPLSVVDTSVTTWKSSPFLFLLDYPLPSRLALSPLTSRPLLPYSTRSPRPAPKPKLKPPPPFSPRTKSTSPNLHHCLNRPGRKETDVLGELSHGPRPHRRTQGWLNRGDLASKPLHGPPSYFGVVIVWPKHKASTHKSGLELARCPSLFLRAAPPPSRPQVAPCRLHPWHGWLIDRFNCYMS